MLKGIGWALLLNNRLDAAISQKENSILDVFHW